MKNIYFLAVACALALYGCTVKVEVDDPTDQPSKSKITLINTVIDALEFDNPTPVWGTGDKVALTDLTTSAEFKLKQGTGTTAASFSGSLSTSAEKLYAVYPADAAKVDGGKLSVTVPTTQNFSQSAAGRFVMLANSADNSNFTFIPTIAVVYLDITLPAERTIRAVTINSEQSGIAGSCVADLTTLSLLQAGSNSITLNYSTPAQGSTKDGWAVMAPIDFKSSTGKVTYNILTDKGVYTFCYKPDLKIEAGKRYTIKLDIGDFVQVEDKNALKQGEYHYNDGGSVEQPDEDPEPEVDSKLNVRVVRKTDSTITIGWTITEANIPYVGNVVPSNSANYSVDVTKQYKVALYRDKECKDLVVSVSPIKTNAKDNKELFTNPICPPRFVFSGLEPATTYYAKVTNLTDNTTNATPVQVTTKAPVANKSAIVKANAGIGDMIVFENFSSLIYAGEMTSRGAGVSRTDRNKITTLNGYELKGEITVGSEGFYGVDATTEIGLFNTLKGIVDDFGLQDWGWIGGAADANGGSVCARPGYLKISTNKNRSFICTPILNAIPKGKLATLRVVFSAAPYGSAVEEGIRVDEKYMAVKALAGAAHAADYHTTYREVVDEHKFTLIGENASDWNEYTVTLTGVPSGSSIALGGALDDTAVNRMFIDDIRVYIEALEDATESEFATGTITYDDGTPAAGVSVSDGFSVVQTDSKGQFKIVPHHDAWYIYYSVPEDCEVNINNQGQPAFFTRYSPTKSTYDFTLKKLAGGKETNFSLFCLADPQCKDQAHRDRFNGESIPDLKAHSASKNTPCYGVTLGDVTYSEGNRNCVAQMPHLRTHMAKGNAGMPIFQTMGNHDYTYFSSSAKINPDETSSTYNIKAQREFESVFGPIDYSWNRGDAHIVCMRNMQWNSNSDAANYSMCFTDEQYQWLMQDLSFVPKDKLVIFCVHIPIVNGKGKNVQNVISLLKQFKETHIMSGHTHYMRNEPTLSGGIYEHVHAAVCGTWWYSRVNGDGSPNGYGVYDIEGNTIKNWYYKGVNKDMNDRDYQMRLYRGNLKCGGEHEYIELQYGEDVLIANVFNADIAWNIKVYENDVLLGNMTKIANQKDSPDAGTSQSNPTKPSAASSQDWWAIGYHIGVVGRGHVGGTRANYLTNGFHLYKYTLKDKNAKIRVEATDRFGRTYSSTDIISDYDYSLMTK